MCMSCMPLLHRRARKECMKKTQCRVCAKQDVARMLSECFQGCMNLLLLSSIINSLSTSVKDTVTSLPPEEFVTTERG